MPFLKRLIDVLREFVLLDIPFLKEIGCDSLKIASADIDFVPILKAAANSGLNVQIDTGSSSSFNSISERYSSINETTSYYKGQEYFVNYLSDCL